MALICVFLMISVIEHLFMSIDLCVLFEEVSTQVFCPLCVCVCVCVFSYISSLYALDINPLSDVSLENMFSVLVGCLLLMVSLLYKTF